MGGNARIFGPFCPRVSEFLLAVPTISVVDPDPKGSNPFEQDPDPNDGQVPEPNGSQYKVYEVKIDFSCFKLKIELCL